MNYDENAIDINDIMQYDIVALELEETSVLDVWGKEQDKYFLLDDLLLNEMDCNLLFHEIRSDVDNAYSGMALKDKYAIIEKRYLISKELSGKLLEEELADEISFSKRRQFIWKLYDCVNRGGKIIYFICDDATDITEACQILKSTGYDKYDRIIKKSDAFAFLSALENQGKKIVSIGRTNYLNNDNCGSVFVPETVHVFSGGYNADITYKNVICRAAGNMVYVPDMLCSPGYSIMLKMVANRFFDNPFVSWKKGTDFNGDPIYLGYYALGMHLIGVVKWLVESFEKKNYKRVLFCARDGLLIKQAYDIYRKYNPGLPDSVYVQGSRKLLLPQLLKSEKDFFNIPGVIYYLNSPYTIMLLLWQLVNIAPLYDYRHEYYKENEEKIKNAIEKAGFSYKKEFKTQEELDCFMDFYIVTFYDAGKHKILRNNIREYYRNYTESDVLFDLGYSGKLSKAIIECSSGIKEVRYLYSNRESIELMCRVGNFNVENFYNFKPAVDNVIREFLISENGPSCLGLKKENDKLIPVFEVDKSEYCKSSTVIAMQESALNFVRDVYSLFKNKWKFIPFKGQEVSMPFEGFIRKIRDLDLEMFGDTYQENYNTGKKSDKNWAEYYKDIMKTLPETMIESEVKVKENTDLKISVIITTLNRKYEVLRALQSVLRQTVPPFEIIIVDDGSTDGTREYLQGHVQTGYRYIYNAKTKGPGRSKNIGVIAAQGDYIAFLDSDNEWYANKIQKFMEAYYNNPDTDVICSKFKKHIEFGVYEYPGNVVDENCSVRDEVLLHNIADASASVYKKSFLEKIDGFNETMKTNLDWELLLRAYTICPPIIYKLQDVLSENWELDDGLSSKTDIELSERLAMLSTYWQDVSDDHLKILFYRQYEQDHKEFASDDMKKIGYYKWVGYHKDWMEFEYAASANLFNSLRDEVNLKNIQIDRKGIFYDFLLKWMEARQKEITIADVLQRDGVSTVAVYGFGRHGHLALEDLKNSHVLVQYIIDKSTDIMSADNLDILDISLELPEVDAIIITPFLEFDSIEKALMEKTKAKLLSLQDLVFEASRLAKEK